MTFNLLTQEQARAVVQGSPEWLEIRRNYITATDAATIMGLNPYETALQLYWKKILGTESKKNPAMQRGIELEPEARLEFARITGHLVSPEFRIHHVYPNSTWMAASFDGINQDRVILEIKCMGKKNHELAIDGIIPEHYKPQLQWQMCVAGTEKMYFMSYFPEHSQSCAIINVEYDPDFVFQMIRQCQVFYKGLMSKEPPEPSERDVCVREDNVWLMMEEEFVRLSRESDAIDARKEDLRKKMIEECDGKPTKGFKLKVHPYSVVGHVQYDKIPQLEGVNLNFFRKPASVRWRIDEV